MLFWKFLAWIAFVFSLVFQRGKDVRIVKGPPKDPDAPDQVEGPGWRRVSRTQVPPAVHPKMPSTQTAHSAEGQSGPRLRPDD